MLKPPEYVLFNLLKWGGQPASRWCCKLMSGKKIVSKKRGGTTEKYINVTEKYIYTAVQGRKTTYFLRDNPGLFKKKLGALFEPFFKNNKYTYLGTWVIVIKIALIRLLGNNKTIKQ